MAQASRDQNNVTTLLAVSNVDGVTPVAVYADPTTHRLLTDNASGGDVDGPASATDNAIARFDGTTGKIIQNSAVTIADTTGVTDWLSNSTALRLGASSDVVLNRYAAKQLMISGDGTGATTNAGLILGYGGVSGYSSIQSTAGGTTQPSFEVFSAPATASSVQLNTPNNVAGSAVRLYSGGTLKFEQLNTAGIGPSITAGTAVTDVNALNVTQTWNEVGTTFTALKLNVTNTTSSASSNLMDLQVGGVSSFKVARNGSTTLAAGASLYAPGGLIAPAGGNGLNFTGQAFIISTADGVLKLSNTADSSFGRLQFGGTTTSFPSIKRSSAAIAFRLADDSADAAITTAGITASGTVLGPSGSGAAVSLGIGAVNVGFYLAAANNPYVAINGNDRWQWTSAGHYSPVTNNVMDIGTSSIGVRTAYIGTSVQLLENASIALDPAGSADGKYTGVTIAGTAGATLAFGDLVYLSSVDSRWELADADAATTADRMMGMVVLAAASDGDPTVLLLMGQIRADAKFPALTIGSAVYVGETAGAIQVAIPTGADNVIRRVGYALTADEIYFNPSMDSQITVA